MFFRDKDIAPCGSGFLYKITRKICISPSNFVYLCGFERLTPKSKKVKKVFEYSVRLKKNMRNEKSVF